MGKRTIGRLLAVGFMLLPLGLAIMCLTFVILGELRLWVVSFAMLCFLIAAHILLIRRLIKRQIRGELAWMERALPEIEQAVADY